MKLASHVWAKIAAERFVLVKGNSGKMMSSLTNCLQIIDIMGSGLLVRYQGRVYPLPIDDLGAGGKGRTASRKLHSTKVFVQTAARRNTDRANRLVVGFSIVATTAYL